jgi:hypothetical protein
MRKNRQNHCHRPGIAPQCLHVQLPQHLNKEKLPKIINYFNKCEKTLDKLKKMWYNSRVTCDRQTEMIV